VSKSVTSGFGSSVFLPPEVPEAAQLRHWYETNGESAPIDNITVRASGGGARPVIISDIDTQQLGHKVNPNDGKAVVSLFDHLCVYSVC
jgi:hypothetical protein